VEDDVIHEEDVLQCSKIVLTYTECVLYRMCPNRWCDAWGGCAAQVTCSMGVLTYLCTTRSPAGRHSSPIECVLSHSSPIECVLSYSSRIECVISHSSPIECVLSYSSPIECVLSHSSPIECVLSHSSPIECVLSYSSPIECVLYRMSTDLYHTRAGGQFILMWSLCASALRRPGLSHDMWILM
jgi:hypothetical protein